MVEPTSFEPTRFEPTRVEPTRVDRRGRSHAGRGAVAVVAVLVLLLTTACASIPRKGPVVEGRPVDGSGGSQVRELIYGPSAGQTPGGILSGFLRAAQGAGDDYEVARTYLTPAAASSWRPADETVVYRGPAPAPALLASGQEVPGGGEDVQGNEVQARLSVLVVATVDAHGRYQQARPGTTRDLEVSLRRVQGQWRIAAVDDVALLSEAAFESAFRSYPIFLLDPTRTFLVPEIRWFPDGRSTATRLVTELLAGPSPWLAPAVATAFPRGTALAPPAAVVARDREAVVHLTADALEASPAERTLMRAQLVGTLQPVLGINRVDLRVDGGRLDDPVDVPLPRDDPEVLAPAVVVLDGALAWLRSRTLEPVADLPDLSGLDISHPAVAVNGRRFAVLAAERSQLRLVQPGDAVASEPVVVGADLTTPSFDWRGWVWTSERVSTGVVSAAPSDGETRTVEAEWLAGRLVTSLRLSRDGSRAVVASTDSAGQGHLELAGVARDADGVPLRLVPQQPATQALDLEVVDQDEVAVLGRTPDRADLVVSVVRLSGPREPVLTALGGVTTVTAAKGVRSVLVGTVDGRLFTLAGSAWVQIPDAAGARYPAYPG